VSEVSSVRLGDVAELIDYGVTASATNTPVGPKFLRITDIQDGKVAWSNVPYCEVSEKEQSEKRLVAGDIVFARTGATTGKSFLIRECPQDAVFASYLIRVRVGEQFDPTFVSHFFDTSAYWNQITKSASGSAQPGVNSTKLKELRIPTAPLEEQRRIAAILDKADAIRRKREEALRLADEFLRSTFLEMFGDPVVNPKGFPQKRLKDSAELTSGGTPNKANVGYWDGDFPWVSPKDMKVDTICDSLDHVSEKVFRETNLHKIPAGTPLIVVRGMILAHTVPLAITGRDVSINQDMKAIRFDSEIDPLFGLWCLKAQHTALLNSVSTAAHGTKRLDSRVLGEFQLMIPPPILQNKFVSIVQKSNGLRSIQKTVSKDSSKLESSLSQRAFRGEL
jgi:type I restriction enzyme S subunit